MGNVIDRIPSERRLQRSIAALMLVTAAHAGTLALSASESNQVTHEQPVTYERDVRPILKANCIRCHGETDELAGGLDLRLRRLAVQGGDSGPAVVAGAPDQSPLWTRVRDDEMPPEDIEKKLTAAERETLRRWIAAGAPTLREEPADADPRTYLTAEERAFWAFQPLQRPAFPSGPDCVSGTEPSPEVPYSAGIESSEASTGIDRFILARLRKDGLGFSPEAEPHVLVRRLYLDLLGIPPTPEEAAEFVADPSPDAYGRLVDRLLASPRYGERWGRHWLDTAGFADSEGYNDADQARPDSWKYRDYVIASWNRDKPFDRFVLEQLAGDELIGRELKELTAEQVEWLTATGFLRMAPDGTAAGGPDAEVARNEVVARTIDIVSTTLLGLTMGCAQCHDHRYDPISQEDYYAFRAVFEPALNWKSWKVPAARRVSLYTDEDRRQAAAVEERAKQIEAERARKQQEFIEQTLERELAKLPSELHEELRTARSTAPGQRTAEQKDLLRKHPSINVDAGSLYLYDRRAADELKKMADEATKVRGEKPREEFVRALWEPCNQAPPKTHLFHRGLFDQPKQEVAPRPPSILAAVHPGDVPDNDPALPTSGRRLAMARWLVHPSHPLTARVLVNRLWLHHFGRGLVATPGDFGMLGARPSHPELLDWLARELIDGGWSIKPVQRLIVTSSVYRQSSLHRADSQAANPENADSENSGYWRMPLRRMDAETLRDSLLAAAGNLNLRIGGPAVPVMADRVGQFVVGVENLDAGRPGAVIPLHGEEFRRSVYVQVRRSRPLSVLDPFDLPRMEPNCPLRASSTVATQSLFLMNSEFVVDCARALAERVDQTVGRDVVEQVRRAWQIAYAAEPSPGELADAVQFVLDQSLYYATHPAPETDGTQGESRPAGTAPADPQRRALITLCHALLSSNRFLYVE